MVGYHRTWLALFYVSGFLHGVKFVVCHQCLFVWRANQRVWHVYIAVSVSQSIRLLRHRRIHHAPFPTSAAVIAAGVWPPPEGKTTTTKYCYRIVGGGDCWQHRDVTNWRPFRRRTAWTSSGSAGPLRPCREPAVEFKRLADWWLRIVASCHRESRCFPEHRRSPDYRRIST